MWRWQVYVKFKMEGRIHEQLDKELKNVNRDNLLVLMSYWLSRTIVIRDVFPKGMYRTQYRDAQSDYSDVSDCHKLHGKYTNILQLMVIWFSGSFSPRYPFISIEYKGILRFLGVKN